MTVCRYYPISKWEGEGQVIFVSHNPSSIGLMELMRSEGEAANDSDLLSTVGVSQSKYMEISKNIPLEPPKDLSISTASDYNGPSLRALWPVERGKRIDIIFDQWLEATYGNEKLEEAQ